ncbi:MAG: TPR end-of-group domain-containing protein [Thermoanaerobaculia bacterium]
MHEVAETLRNAKERGCSLLIGAGCSATAQIPLASGFVQEFARRYPERYARVAQKTYPHCMGELAYDERNDLIAPFIDNAKINWAHMAIAQLMKEGYVTRILTTNFDPLLTRACAMVGVFPAVYDLAASQIFKAERVYEPSVFYLHGQRAGFVTLHTEDEVRRHKETLAPVFEDAGKGRVWIVCGYSGENDPVFDHLADVPSFGCNLYWVGFKDEPLGPHVRDRLLREDKYAFHVRGYDADGFFVELARALDCFPPAIIARPFSHLLEVTDFLAPFTIGDSTADLRETARTRIQAAIEAYEPGEGEAQDLGSDALDAMFLLFAGKYEEVLETFAATDQPSEELRTAAAWALVAQADQLWQGASAQPARDTRDTRWESAYAKYAEALQIKPDMHEALYNWGNALWDQAKTKTGGEADASWQAAGEKYAAALAIKPDKHEALNNWGNALSDQAETKTGGEADALWEAAGEKYAAALAIKPDKHEALNNWGIALSNQAKTKTGVEADALWQAAGEKYAAALAIKPDMHEALNNWSNALIIQAARRSPEEREPLLAAAAAKCRAANDIVPGTGSYNLACIHGIRGEAEDCRTWLLHAREHGHLPPREHLLADPDLETVRDEAWFRELVGEPPELVKDAGDDAAVL